jgi:hypothetical protein
MTRSSDSPMVWSSPPLLPFRSCVGPQSMSSWSVMRPPAATEERAAIVVRTDRKARRCAVAAAMVPGCRWCEVRNGVACGGQWTSGQVQAICRDYGSLGDLTTRVKFHAARSISSRTRRRHSLLGGVNKFDYRLANEDLSIEKDGRINSWTLAKGEKRWESQQEVDLI